MSNIFSEYAMPETATEALSLWEADVLVPSIEMGGLGPGYELAIQTLAFGIIKRFENEPVDWVALDADDEKERSRILSISDEVADELDKTWGFSGAQVGAAKGLAFRTLRVGWKAALQEINEDDPDRIILVSRDHVILGD